MAPTENPADWTIQYTPFPQTNHCRFAETIRLVDRPNGFAMVAAINESVVHSMNFESYRLISAVEVDCSAKYQGYRTGK